MCPETLSRLRNLAFQCGATAARLFKGVDLPDGLTIRIIDAWLRGVTEVADPTHFKLVLDAYSAFAKDHISTERFRFTLKRQIERTGLSPRKLLMKCDGQIPDGLTATEIARWTNKQPIPAPKSHVTFVLDAYKALPCPTNNDDELIRAADRLRSERNRTRLSFRAILHGQNIPGVSASKLEKAAAGTGHRLSIDQIGAVLALYDALPSRMKVTAEESRARLVHEKARTGWSAVRLLKAHGEPGESPNGIALDRFRTGAQDSVSRSDYERALKLYGLVPSLNR